MLYPDAIVKLIPHGAEDPPIVPCGLVYHVAAHVGPTLIGIFDPGIESHWYVRLDGKIEQYRDTGTQADAQLAGNSFMREGQLVGFLSVETEGLGEGEWTEAQLTTLKDLSRWVHEQFDIPLRVCEVSQQPGYAFHSMFPEWMVDDTKTCPGPDRKKQFRKIIVPWLEAGAPKEEPDMQLKDTIGKDTDVTVGQVFRRMDRYLSKTVPAMRQQIQKVREAVDEAPDGATAADVKRIVNRALDNFELPDDGDIDDADEDTP